MKKCGYVNLLIRFKSIDISLRDNLEIIKI